MIRSLATVALYSTLFGLSRGADRFLLLVLRQDSGESLIAAALRNVALLDLLLPAAGWGVAGVAVALGASTLLSRLAGVPREECWKELRRPFLVLMVPVALTLAAAASLQTSSAFPYGSNLAVSLALEGSFSRLLTLLLFVVVLAHALVRLLGAPRRTLPALGIVGLAMIVFTFTTPTRFYQEGVGQGNMFKYVRMAQTLAGTGTLDISRAEENDAPSLGEFVSFFPSWAGAYVRASWDLVTGAEPERPAGRVNRSMFRGVDGGVYYINAPGPGVLLTPAYLLDETLRRWLGWDLQLAIIVFWQLIGALLVLEIVRSVEGMAARPAGTLAAFAVGTTVPALFYTFQIYPELPAGLLILYAFRKLVIERSPTSGGVVAASVSLAILPWLHQKYSVLAAVLGIYAGLKLLRRTPGGIAHHPAKLVLLGAPLAISAYSIFLYNHALTGSLAPTATFEAVERSSFEPWNFFKGMSGLLFDRENGLFVFAPIYITALVGARAFYFRERRIFAPFALVLLSYLVVIASFPYWPGAISTMGRYILSVLPLFALPMALVFERARADGTLAGVGATLLAGSFAYCVSFTRDLVPSHQPWLFWDRALFVDAHQYLPTFLSDGFLGSGPAHAAKFAVQLLVVGTLVALLRNRVYREPESLGVESSRFHRDAVVGAVSVLALCLVLGSALERWPGNESDKTGPVFRSAMELSRGRRLEVDGVHGFEGDGVWVPGGGRTRFLLRSSVEVPQLTLRFLNGPEDNVVRVRERREPAVELALPERGPHERTILLRKPYRFDGPAGARFLYAFTVDSEGGFVPAEGGVSDDARRLGTYVRIR